MTDSRFPDDLFEQLRQLTARVAQLEAQQGQRPGVTKASQGWLMVDMSIPSVPAGHVQIGSNDGDLYVALSDGTVKRPPGTGGSVESPTVNLSNAPAAYDVDWAQDLATSVSAIYQSYSNGLLPELRLAHVIADV